MPKATEVHIDAALSEFAMRWTNPDGAFIAERLCKTVPVGKQSDKYYIYDKNNLRNVPSSLRAEGDEPKVISHKLSNEQYFCQDHEYADDVTIEQRENADPAIDPEQDAVEALMEVMSIDFEREVAALMTNPSNITQYTTKSTTGQWSDPTNSDPFADIATGIQAVKDGCLRLPNTLVIPDRVILKLRQHDGYIDRIKYTGNPMLSGGLVSGFEGFSNILVSQAAYVSGQEGLSDSSSDIWGKHVLIGYVPGGNPSKRNPTGLARFLWGAFPARQVRRWPIVGPKKERFAFSNGYYDIKLTANEFWYLIRTAIA